MMKKQCKEVSGFTMVEFSLATAFIALLLISITIITSNIIAIYQKGLTVKAVNSVGRGLIDEFTRGVNAAPSVDYETLCRTLAGTGQATCKNDRAAKYIFQEKTQKINFEGEGEGTVQVAGIFCTGKYSYVWNTHYGEKINGGKSKIKIVYNGGHSSIDTFDMLRIDDSTYRVCSKATGDNYASDLDHNLEPVIEIDISTLANGTPSGIQDSHIKRGFLQGYDLELDLYELVFFKFSQDPITLRTFIPGSFVLATNRGNINVTRDGNYCDIHNYTNTETASNLADLGAEFNYCAINKFNFAARTAGM